MPENFTVLLVPDDYVPQDCGYDVQIVKVMNAENVDEAVARAKELIADGDREFKEIAAFRGLHVDLISSGEFSGYPYETN